MEKNLAVPTEPFISFDSMPWRSTSGRTIST